jgi:hypothetical protein
MASLIDGESSKYARASFRKNRQTSRWRLEMRVPRCHAILFLLSIALLLGQWSCAHMPKPPSEEMRAQFGTIGIVSAASNPKIQFHPEFAKGRLSGVGKGASMGTGAGALYGLSLMARGGSCGGQACAAVAIIAAASAAIGAVVGGVAGGIEGAVNAVPKTEANKIEATTKNAFDGIGIQETMAASVFKNSLELPDHTFILLGKDNFMISTQNVLSLLAEKGINTVLELNVKEGGFKGGKGKNPSVALFMKVHARLIRTTDGREIYSREFEYKSSTHPSADWLDADGRLLEEEIDHCFKEFPRQIVEELFGKQSC